MVPLGERGRSDVRGDICKNNPRQEVFPRLIVFCFTIVIQNVRASGGENVKTPVKKKKNIFKVDM